MDFSSLAWSVYAWAAGLPLFLQIWIGLLLFISSPYLWKYGIKLGAWFILAIWDTLYGMFLAFTEVPPELARRLLVRLGLRRPD